MRAALSGGEGGPRCQGKGVSQRGNGRPKRKRDGRVELLGQEDRYRQCDIPPDEGNQSGYGVGD